MRPERPRAPLPKARVDGPRDPWSPVAGRLLQPLHDAWTGNRSPRYVAQVERILRLPRPRARAWLLERLRFLLGHAQATVPFWRRRMAEAGFDPGRLRSPKDLARLPALRRAEVAPNAADLISTRYRGRRLLETQSGGTTSDPVALVQHRDAAWCKMAAAHVFRRRLGWRRGDRMALLWAFHDHPEPARTWPQRWKQVLTEEWLHRRLWLSAASLSDVELEAYAAALARFGPAVLQAFPSAADLLARYLLERGRRLSIPRVVLTAETVFEAQRHRIAEAFQANVYSFYGAREVGWIAEECPAERRLHVNTAGAYLEADEEGRLYVTDLVDVAAPLLRYEIGDRGRLTEEPCPCGDPRPVLAELQGRVLDVLETPSGRKVPGVLLDVRNWHVDSGLLETQIVQTERDRLLVRWVAAPHWRPDSLEAYRKRLEDFLRGELAISFERADRIEPEPNGKVRYCITLPAEPGGATTEDRAS